MSRRVLIGAYACEPNSGSEPAVGWNWARQVALAGNEVHVITRANNRTVIETEIAERPIQGLSFHYVDLWLPFRMIKSKTGTLGLVGYYYLWQLALWRKAKILQQRFVFDVAHHVTFANDWLPSGLALTDIPFVWGPIGGSSHRVPGGFSANWSANARVYEGFRRFIQRAFLGLDPLLRLTRRKAVAVLPYTKEAQEVLPKDVRSRSQVVTHIGVEPRTTDKLATPGRGDRVQVVAGGRLVHWKGFDLLIEGMARAGNMSEIDLVVTGDGPARGDLEDLANGLGLGSAVSFTGWMPSVADVHKTLLESDIYALLTLRDGPPVAVLEAMYAGLPILYVDIGAPAELVPEGAGFGIRPGTRDQTIDRIADVFRTMDAKRGALSEMGDRAHRHAVAVHAWDVIGRQIDSVYDCLDEELADGR